MSTSEAGSSRPGSKRVSSSPVKQLNGLPDDHDSPKSSKPALPARLSPEALKKRLKRGMTLDEVQRAKYHITYR
jgi:hypothetical protein